MEPLLRVRDLSIAFGARCAVDRLSFDVYPGETVALVGESGSGKSATALALMRLVEREGGRITGGSARLAGTPTVDLVEADERSMRAIRGDRIAMVFQEPMTALNPVMRVGEQVAEVLRLHRGLDPRAAREGARDAFERVRIPDAARRLDQYPHELSGGLRQRVMIAIALACRPQILIADEPTTALDVTTQAQILELLSSLRDELDMSVLFITHDMGVVAEIAQRMVVLKDGRKQEDGAVADVFRSPRAAYTRMLLEAAPRLGDGAPQAPAPSDPVAALEDLRVVFPVGRGLLPGSGRDYHAVNGVSLTIGRGETLGLVGESGCGKSTVARALMRLVRPTAGRVRLMGVDVTNLPEPALRPHRRRAQIVFQDPFASLNPRLPVYDLVTEPAAIHGLVAAADRRDLAADLLDRVGLPRDAVDRYPHQFSGGQRQRLCIARALSARPSLIVADEPVSALDVSVARRVTDLMARLQEEDGTSFLFISHDLAVVERVSHRVAIMFAGQIIETGPTDAVLNHPRHPYTAALLRAVPVPDPERRRPTASQAFHAPPALLLPRGERPTPWPLRDIDRGHAVAAALTPSSPASADAA